ncbi:PTS sugar transporter subunit IIA [Kocuria coralli]|uniref:Ascorbate-specific PTS system EIIA component n=1 Tax=Kocuria coralli TaxID=1461025 RepID=A0A5J5KZL2_9MICC|nr:PTS sugar transporter subunit IIA [Kocuria coralli]KAA9394848.1 PTS sugar transporter subunit IIA [Kocuria coralli]
MAQLHELVTPGSIRLNVRARDWREAVRVAGKLLTNAGAGTPGYTDAMIENVRDHGPAIVIAPGFAFAHAQAPALVKHTGMAWVRLKKPVNFGSDVNDPVVLIAALASAGSTEHIQAMRQLVSVVGNEFTRTRLESAVDVEEFLSVLGRVDKR